MTRRDRAAFAWYAVTALNCGLALVIQLVLVAKGHNVLVEPDGSTAGALERLLRFFSYFTVQSNILAAITTGILAAAVVAPARYRLDGTWWKVTRFAAVLGMTTTIIVYAIVLAPILDLHGIAQVTDVMFHYIGPVLTLGGWLLFDRHGQVTRRLIGVVTCWPLAYFVYTQVLGAISGWYPYPFLDADKHGTGRVLLNAVVVTVLVVGLALVFLAVDRRLAERADRRTPTPAREGVN